MYNHRLVLLTLNSHRRKLTLARPQMLTTSLQIDHIGSHSLTRKKKTLVQVFSHFNSENYQMFDEVPDFTAIDKF